MISKLVTAASVGLAVVALVFAGVVWSRLSGVEASATRTQTAETSRISQLENQVASLQNKMTSLTVPTDPLSAYNQICNQQFTNGQTGVTQTYYLPCTNSAQTIPQPGQ
jgi:hypothetical protein